MRIQGFSNAAYNEKVALVKCLPDEVNGEFNIELPENEVASPLSRVIVVKPENVVHACSCCYKSVIATTMFCGGCRVATYCNAACQRDDWKRHKADCKQLGETRVLSKDVMKHPLIMAALRGDLAEVRALVKRGAKVNRTTTNGDTVFYVAAQHGYLEVVHYLEQNGANTDRANDDGATPLYAAALRGHLGMVQHLVQQGADKN